MSKEELTCKTPNNKILVSNSFDENCLIWINSKVMCISETLNRLEQQCKKQKEVINRIFNETTETRNIIINNRGDNILTHGSLIHYLGIVEDILKEVSE